MRLKPCGRRQSSRGGKAKVLKAQPKRPLGCGQGPGGTGKVAVGMQQGPGGDVKAAMGVRPRPL